MKFYLLSFVGNLKGVFGNNFWNCSRIAEKLLNFREIIDSKFNLICLFIVNKIKLQKNLLHDLVRNEKLYKKLHNKDQKHSFFNESIFKYSRKKLEDLNVSIRNNKIRAWQ